MLDDGNKAVSYDRRANLYSDSVFCCTPEFLNLEVLLEPLEEQLDLPAILVEIGYFERREIECIRQKCEVSILLVIVKSPLTFNPSNPAKMFFNSIKNLQLQFFSIISLNF